MEYKYKGCTYGIKDLDPSKRLVRGVLSSFGNVDSDGDVINRGAFKKTLEERGPKADRPRIKHLLDHDTRKAIGVFKDLEETAEGLEYTSVLGQHTLGRDVMAMYEDGIITEHSIGFEILDFEQDGEITLIKEARLWEGSSLQAWGANPNTPVKEKAADRFKTKEDVVDRIEKLTKALDRGKYSDETMSLFAIELKQITNSLSDILGPLEESTPAGPSEQDTQMKAIGNLYTFIDNIKIK